MARYKDLMITKNFHVAPDKMFDEVVFPRQPNEKAIGEYLTSRKVTREIPKLFEHGDNINRDIKASYYLANKKLDTVESRLKHKRRCAVEARKSLDKQWEELNIKEEELRELFIKFNFFVEVTAEKRQRATINLQTLSETNALRALEIEERKNDYEEMTYLWKRIDKLVKSNSIYEKYLWTVVESNAEKFKNPMDVVKRFETLLHARKTLLKYHQDSVTALDNVKVEYLKMINACCVKLAGLHVRLADLNQRYESAKRNALKWEALLLTIRSDTTEKIIDLTTIKESCRRMYRQICERKGVEPVFMDDYVKQLDVIKRALHDFECINGLVRALEEEKLTLSEKPCMSSGTE